MKRLVFLIMALFCLSGYLMAQGERLKVAVYVTGDVDDSYKKVIGSKMVSAITASQGYTAVERTADFLAALSQEHDYQSSGAVNDSQIVKLGQRFGVRYVVVADVTEIFGSMFISARMINVSTGLITASSESSRTIDTLEGLMSLSEEVAEALLGTLAHKWGTGKTGNHEYVDLGLSVRWATCNLGATVPYQYGNYYAWGETSTKSSYTENNSRTYEVNLGEIAGVPGYDPARAAWGSEWRLPTAQELQELVDRCIWEWTSLDGIAGYKVTGPNGNSIFLPAAGYYFYEPGSLLSGVGESGYYWISTSDGGIAINWYFAKCICFDSDDYAYYDQLRFIGASIRPVTDK